MARKLSSFIQGLFDEAAATGERAFRTHTAVMFTLSNGTSFNVATGEILLTSKSYNHLSVPIDPVSFVAKAIKIPSFRHSQGTAPDAGELSLINLDYVISQLIPEPTRLFDGAKAKVYICFPKPDGTYEGVLYFIGHVRGLSGDDDEAPITLISDLSDKKAVIGEEITQRCLHELGDDGCGAQFLDPDDECSKEFDDKENGCWFYGQMHAFSGVPFINPSALVAGYGGTGTGGGWDEPIIRTGCVDLFSWIRTIEGGWIHAPNLKEGDPVEDLRGRISLVKKIEEKFVNYRYLIEATNGAELICSADHPLISSFDDEKGKQAYTLRNYLDVLNGDAEVSDQLLTVCEGFIEHTDKFKLFPLAPGKVLNISLEGNIQTYTAGAKKGFGFDGHNNKPVYSFTEIRSS